MSDNLSYYAVIAHSAHKASKIQIIYKMIQKDRLKEPVLVVGGMASTVNGASTHARQLVAVFQVLCSLYGLTCVGYAHTLLNSSHVLL